MDSPGHRSVLRIGACLALSWTLTLLLFSTALDLALAWRVGRPGLVWASLGKLGVSGIASQLLWSFVAGIVSSLAARWWIRSPENRLYGAGSVFTFIVGMIFMASLLLGQKDFLNLPMIALIICALGTNLLILRLGEHIIRSRRVA